MIEAAVELRSEAGSYAPQIPVVQPGDWNVLNADLRSGDRRTAAAGWKTVGASLLTIARLAFQYSSYGSDPKSRLSRWNASG